MKVITRQAKTAAAPRDSYPRVLDSPREIAEYIASLDPTKPTVEFLEQSLRDEFGDCRAELRELPIASLKPSGLHVIDYMRQYTYDKSPQETQPPIVVIPSGVVIDGSHRFRSTRRRGSQSILAYQIVPGDGVRPRAPTTKTNIDNRK